MGMQHTLSRTGSGTPQSEVRGWDGKGKGEGGWREATDFRYSQSEIPAGTLSRPWLRPNPDEEEEGGTLSVCLSNLREDLAVTSGRIPQLPWFL